MRNTDVILQILDSEVSYYTDIDNPLSVYVEYKGNNGALNFYPVESPFFQSFLAFRYLALTNEATTPDFSSYLNLNIMTERYQQNHPVKIRKRLAGNLHQGITYFLANDKWQSVQITAKNWSIKNSVQEKFLKSPDTDPQVTPVSGGDFLELLKPYVNLDADSFLLFAVYLLQCFSERDHYAAVLSSSKGTGKSTLTKIIRSIVDPSKTGVSLMPNNERDLKTLLAASYLVCFDNTSHVPSSFSDILCGAVTGVKAPTRTLYTTCSQTILDLHNAIVLNGIDAVPKKSDLAERSLLFQLQPIRINKRKTYSDLIEDFERDRPHILGAAFDILSSAMSLLPTITSKQLSRMADAHKEMLAIALALGISESEFQRIIKQNRQLLENEYAQDNHLVEIICHFMEGQNKVSGKSSDLYQKILNSIVGDYRDFPNSPSALTKKLNQESDALKASGFVIEREKKTDANILTIKRIPSSFRSKSASKKR